MTRTACCFFLLTLSCLVHVSTQMRDATCNKACSVPQENTREGTQLLKYMCHCVAEQKLDTMPTTTTTTTTTTTPKPDTTINPNQICDYLCSIQMGGDACKCSNPSLPGK